MTSPSLRKHPITAPSIPRSTRTNIYPLLLAALVFAPGCGITPNAFPAGIGDPTKTGQPAIAPKRHESSRYSFHRTEPAPRQTSRFADIKRLTFFEAPDSIAERPNVPPPAPVAVESVLDRPNVAEPIPVLAIPAANKIRAIPSSGPVDPQIRQVQAQRYENEDKIPDPVDDPRKLKKITEIEPYAHYEPDPVVRAEDPCKNLCPRPNGTPCKTIEGKPPLCPEEVVLSNEDYIPRAFHENVFGWEASNVHYNPLYFEDFALERYGHTYPCWVQPFASVGKFSVQLVGLPYQMGIDPVWKKMYPLGFYRPGECAPKLCYQIPWNTRAAAIQAGVTTGMFYLIP